MPVSTRSSLRPQRVVLPVSQLKPNDFSLSIYGDPTVEIDDLLPSIREHGILVALVVAAGPLPGIWEVISGHRRLACAQALGLTRIPCEVRYMPDGMERCRSILEYNRQRRKTFSQLMREADAIEKLWKPEASARRISNLRQGQTAPEKRTDLSDGRNSAIRSDPPDLAIWSTKEKSASPQSRGRTDATIAQLLEMGGKDLYRQARTIWRLAQSSDLRAQNAVAQLDAKSKTIHAAYKDLRRRDRFSR